MSEHVPTRDEALRLLTRYNESESLLNHALAVEGCMRWMARKHGEDEEKWGVVGLIHDLDYEQWPDEHCQRTEAILREEGWPEEYIRAVLAHGWGLRTDVEPKTLMEKTLYAIDELTGFVTACALVRPSKSVLDLNVKSAKKKWKQKSFAAGANRDVIERGAAMLGVELDELMADVIDGMRAIASDIGLQGTASE
ncbi:MAG TPA: hydrolase [Planctomycetaceae bacterium]|nr:hydrolase [Planctomycetaceae bacterium]